MFDENQMMGPAGEGRGLEACGVSLAQWAEQREGQPAGEVLGQARAGQHADLQGRLWWVSWQPGSL
jgi:hypothetical protein